MVLKNILEELWDDYVSFNPSPEKIVDLFSEKGEKIVNDHIAFRTFNDPRVNLDAVIRPFIKLGYEPKGKYHFLEKNLFARHYEYPNDSLAPKIFVSELILEDFPEDLQKTIRSEVDKVPEELIAQEELIFAGSVFGKPSFKIYQKLKKESEYAAWLYVFGYRANHFAISVNHLQHFNKLEEVNTFLKENGFELNTFGGEIKGTKKDLLRQSSTLADKIEVQFEEGPEIIPACYYEFAERGKDHDGQIYQGFIAESADRIFESTNYRK